MKTTTMPMLETYPAEINLDRTMLASMIDTLIACSEACTACADACLSEQDIGELAKCIRTNMDCADICATTARVLSRHTGYDANISRTLLQACAIACKSCGDEWRPARRHARALPHLRAGLPRRLKQACNELLAAIS